MRTLSLIVVAALLAAVVTTATPARAGFVLLDNFESHTLGMDIDTAGGWVEFGGPVIGGPIVPDPDNPSSQVAQLTGAQNNAGYKLNLGASTIPDNGSEATIFFRYRTTGALSVYLTDEDALTSGNWFSQDEFGLYNRDVSGPSDIRGHFNTGVATTVNQDEWHNVWIHVQNKTTPAQSFDLANSERYFIYLDGVLVNGTDGNSDNSFDTRSWTSNVPAIDTLFIVSNDGTAGGYIDDIYIDNTGLNLTNPIPEPSTFLLAIVGLLSLGVVGWRRRCNAKSCISFSRSFTIKYRWHLPLAAATMTLVLTTAAQLPIVIDNGDASYSSGAGWSGFSSGGEFNGDQEFNNDNGATAATYSFGGLANGKYDVYAQWRLQANRSTDVEYTISAYGGSNVVVSGINQRFAPTADLWIDDTNGAGTLTFPFQLLTTLKVSTGSLVLEVRDNDGTGANTFAIADAAAVNLVPEPRAILLFLTGAVAFGLMRRRRC